MKHMSLFFAVIGVILLLLSLPGTAPTGAHPAVPVTFTPPVSDDVTRAAPLAGQSIDEIKKVLATSGRARVLIALHHPVALAAPAAEQASAVHQAQESVLSWLTADDFDLIRRYTYIPGLAGTITGTGLDKLQAHPLVASIQLDEQGGGHLGESVPALGADTVHGAYNLTGEGVVVAVLDTGIDTDHPDLSDHIVAQHCFTHGDCAPGNTDEGTSAEDEHGHGTNVSGILASRGIVSSVGFAPGAEIVAVRVLDADNRGWVSDWVAGLDWVRGNLGALNVRVINMSLGTDALYTDNCDAQWPLMANAVGQLAAAGVVIFSSTGNQGSSDSIDSPACNTGVIAVGATYDSDLGREPDFDTYRALFGGNWPDCYDASTDLQRITCFTNSNAMLDIVAPGARITASGIGGGTLTYRGTSQASPTAAGIAALLLQANSNLTPSDIEDLLRTSGTMITDPKNQLEFPAINALSAVEALLQTVTPTTTPTSTITPTNIPTSAVTPTNTPTATGAPVNTPTATATPTSTSTGIPTATNTPTSTATSIPTIANYLPLVARNWEARPSVAATSASYRATPTVSTRRP